MPFKMEQLFSFHLGALQHQMKYQGSQNQALEQTRDSVLRHGEPVGRELLNLVVRRSR